MTGHEYLNSKYRLLLRTLFIQEFLALVAVWIYDSFIIESRIQEFTSSHHWNLLFSDAPATTAEDSNKRLRRPIRFLVKHFSRSKQKESSELKAAEGFSRHRVARVTLNSNEEMVGAVLYWSLEEYPSNREIIIEPINPEYVPLLPPEIQDIARITNSGFNIYLPLRSIEKISMYYLDIPKPPRTEN